MRQQNKESEKVLERKLVRHIAELGGWCIKLPAQHITGLPDRLCLMPGGVAFFVEVKTTGEKPRKIQTLIHQRLRGLGFKVLVIDKSIQIKEIV